MFGENTPWCKKKKPVITIMEVGKYYKMNQEKISSLRDDDWKVALIKCKEHIQWRLKQKTLSGAHSGSNLGAEAIDHYLSLSYEKIICGEWEWKDEYCLAEQMIRIVNSHISTEVEKKNSKKSDSFNVKYTDREEQFYEIADEPSNSLDNIKDDARLRAIENAVEGDIELGLIIEALKEGKKRAEIAELLEIGLRQFDKLKEKLIRKVKAKQASTN